MTQQRITPPAYCPDALATDVGWISPKTGELLVSIKNLRAKLAQNQPEYVRDIPTNNFNVLLDAITENTQNQPAEDQRSPTQKMLDELTVLQTKVREQPNEFNRTLDKLTEHTISKVTKKATAADEKPAARKPGRPRKIKTSKETK